MGILIAVATVALCPQEAESRDDRTIREQMARTTYPGAGEMSLREFVRQASEAVGGLYIVAPGVDMGQVVVVEQREVLDRLTVAEALETALSALDPPLTWDVRGRVLLVFPRLPAGLPDQAPAIFEIYDVRDITYVPWDYPGPDRVFGRSVEPSPPQENWGAEDLADIIQTTIEPESWEASPNWSLTVDSGALCVMASEGVHERIREMLDGFRAVGWVEVHVEGHLVEMPTEDAWSWLSPSHSQPDGVLTVAQEAWLEEAIGTGLARTRGILRVAAWNNQRNNASEETGQRRAGGAAALLSSSNVLDVRPTVSHDRKRVLLDLKATFSQPASDTPQGPAGDLVLDVYSRGGFVGLPRDRAVVASAVARGDQTVALVLRAVVLEGRPEEAEPPAAGDEDFPQAVQESLQLHLSGEAAAAWLRERPGPDLSPDDLRGWLGQGHIENWSLLANRFDTQGNVIAAAVVPAPSRAGGESSEDEDPSQDARILWGVTSGGRVVRGPAGWIFDVQHHASPPPAGGPPEPGAPVTTRLARATVLLQPGEYRIIAEHGSPEELIVTLVCVRGHP